MIWIIGIVVGAITYWVGLFSGRTLLRTTILNALQYQRQLAHYSGDTKVTNILDNLIARTKDA